MPLILSRKRGEAIHIDGPAVIRIHELRAGKVRLAIEAEDSTGVMREELVDVEDEESERAE